MVEAGGSEQGLPARVPGPPAVCRVGAGVGAVAASPVLLPLHRTRGRGEGGGHWLQTAVSVQSLLLRGSLGGPREEARGNLGVRATSTLSPSDTTPPAAPTVLRCPPRSVKCLSSVRTRCPQSQNGRHRTRRPVGGLWTWGGLGHPQPRSSVDFGCAPRPRPRSSTHIGGSGAAMLAEWTVTPDSRWGMWLRLPRNTALT